jgi:hypothetical protein
MKQLKKILEKPRPGYDGSVGSICKVSIARSGTYYYTTIQKLADGATMRFP